MASSDLNLVDSLEESFQVSSIVNYTFKSILMYYCLFQACIHSLTKEESSAGVDKGNWIDVL